MHLDEKFKFTQKMYYNILKKYIYIFFLNHSLHFGANRGGGGRGAEDITVVKNATGYTPHSHASSAVGPSYCRQSTTKNAFRK